MRMLTKYGNGNWGQYYPFKVETYAHTVLSWFIECKGPLYMMTTVWCGRGEASYHIVAKTALYQLYYVQEHSRHGTQTIMFIFVGQYFTLSHIRWRDNHLASNSSTNLYKDVLPTWLSYGTMRTLFV